MSLPWWMLLYVLIFAIILISNLVFHIKQKVRINVLLYELLSGFYVILLIFAYWTPSLLEKLGIINILAFFIILAIDIYYSIWGDIRRLGIEMPNFSEKDIEKAKAVSLIFASPAYITGFLVLIKIISTINI